MHTDAPIYVAGHRGLVGSAIVRRLQRAGHSNLLLRSRAELDLTDSVATEGFFRRERPAFVFLAAAKVGGIIANNTLPAEFVRDNLAIQTNVIHAAWQTQVERLFFLGSSCIYPRLAAQPLQESSLLSGALEPTNRPYALAKIAGIEMCWSYNRQYGTKYLAAMPTNLYGPGDNYHPSHSHVIPGMLRKFHEAKARGADAVTLWGSGTPKREFMYIEDMADACVHIMNLPADRYTDLLGSDEAITGRFEPPLINIGVGHDHTISDLARLVGQVVGFQGDIVYDRSKPDGTPRKLMDVSRLGAVGWRASMPLEQGLRRAYEDFCAHAVLENKPCAMASATA